MSSLSTKDLAKKLGSVRKATPLQQSAARTKSLGVKQPLSYLVVLDFEATCWDKSAHSFGKNEIIEFPAVILDVDTGLVADEFQKFVRPTENPTLSDFCVQLTGITQDQVDTAGPLSLCLDEFESWIGGRMVELGAECYDHSNYRHRMFLHDKKLAAFVTWSDWDLGQCLQNECLRKSIKKPRICNSWIDLRLLYRNFYKRFPAGLRDAVEHVGLEFEGRAHSGIVDSRNTARLARRMMTEGCVLKITRTIEGSGKRVHTVPPVDSMRAVVDRVKREQRKDAEAAAIPNKKGRFADG